MGHMSRAILERHSHIRREAERDCHAAVERVSSKRVPQDSPKVAQIGASVEAIKMGA
jgi:hypothetical protein